MSDTPEQPETKEGETTYWSQPNQQVVREGEPVGITDDNPDPQQSEGAATTTDKAASLVSGSSGGTFNPAEHSVQEVQDYVTANSADAQRVLDAERTGKQRTTLISWLEDS